MIVLGLTGSIGMGKSTTAAMFAAEGVPVYDADAAVHALYAAGGPAAPLLEAAFPGTTRDGAVDRVVLGARVVGDPEALKRLEAIIHPLVAESRVAFFAREAEADVVVLDIPLLFETRGDRAVDAVVVVTAPSVVQRARVMARPGMTPEKLDAILARQTPDADKRAASDFVIDTSAGMDAAREAVRDILKAVRGPAFRSRRA